MRKAIVTSARGRDRAGRSTTRRRLKAAADPTRRRAAGRSTGLFPIVGIGASAGGLEAVTQLLKQLPQSPGMAFVLVQHLDPSHESALSALLSRTTPMPVREARNNLPVESNHVYVIPPNKIMLLSKRRLKLSLRRDARSDRMPVDHFLESLAEQERDRAIGVILSGSGSDGTRGLLAVKAANGITFAQDEKSAKYNGMPASAIGAGCVDFVLTPEQIAHELARLAGHPFIALRPASSAIEREQPVEEKTFGGILAFLRQRTGVDFSQYKHATLHRRVRRRMALRQFESLQDYAGHLLAHPTEYKELFSDFLIHVTRFFRDASLFQALRKKIFPMVLNNRSAGETIRIWVPGCSTGEEVYSIAIVILELMRDRKVQYPVQIFGTDILESALEKARMGVYPESIKADVSAERLRRFFRKTERKYRVQKAIREMCIFARQDMVIDPPFSNLDMISCRNVLIYLGAPLQQKVMPVLHYALKPNGFLVLGASETVGTFTDLFALLDNRVRSYSKKATHLQPAVNFSHRSFNQRLAAKRLAPIPPSTAGPSLSDLQKRAERILLGNYCPAGVIVNVHMEVLQFRGHTGPFLEHAHGDASLNLLKMAREGITLELRAALDRAIRHNVRVVRPGVCVSQNGRSVETTIEVIPYTVPPARDRFFLVLFQPRSGLAEATAETSPRGRGGAGGPRGRGGAGGPRENTEVSRLNDELATLRESLQSTNEEQEATMEELRSANEEIMSSNEELQSTNEELETAKEELQSTNEELTTLNDQLEHRNSELEHVNNDLHNVLGNVNIPIVLLGQDLRIRRFTSAAEKLFGLIPADIGRPITDINLRLDLPDLSKLVLEVIDNLRTKELEVKDHNGRWWSTRIRPYKTIDNRIEGAIIAFVDIELSKASAEIASQNRVIAEALINTMRQPVLVLDKELVVRSANEAFYGVFQTSARETIHNRVYDLGNAHWNIPKLRTLLEDILPHDSSFKDFEVEQNFPRIGRTTMILNARRLTLDGKGQELILLAIEPHKSKPQ